MAATPVRNGRGSTLCRIYLMAVLSAAGFLSPFPYSPVALTLLLAIIGGMRTRSPRLNIPLFTALLFFVPVVLSSLALYSSYPVPLVETAATMAALPALYLLDGALKGLAPDVQPRTTHHRRTITPVCSALLASAGGMVAVAILTGSRVLAMSGAALFLYVAAALFLSLSRIPRQPLLIPAVERRIVASETAATTLSVRSNSRGDVYCYLTPEEPWAEVRPASFPLNGAAVPLEVSVTPPLAGPSTALIHASVIDGRGLLQTDAVVDAVSLHVIPRAQYAEWLAVKYLEQGGTRASAPAVVYSAETARRRGTDYHESRSYQPGDRLRDIDWKHTVKLRQLITREYADAGGQTAIIAVDLGAADAEGVDRLAFHLITTALTLAERGVPTALTAYSAGEVVVNMALRDPAEILREALHLVRRIARTEASGCYLQPPDLKRLRRSMSQLREATSGPARQLLGILDLESRAIDYAARKAVAQQALSGITSRIPPPATVILISAEPAQDAPSLIERLEARGFRTLTIDG